MCTKVQQYNSTAVQQYNSTAVQQYNSTTVQQYNSTAGQEYSSTAVQQYNSTTGRQYNSTAVQHHNINTIYTVKLHRNESKTFPLILKTLKGFKASARTKGDLDKSGFGDSRQQCNKMGNAGVTQKLIGVLSTAFPNISILV